MSLFAFVLMPSARQFNPRYERIKKAADEAEVRAERVDKQFFSKQGITQKIKQQIIDADILIADMSNHNPNVFYEVGFAHAKDKLCILLAKSGSVIPFDLKDWRHVIFSGLDDLQKKLLKELQSLRSEMELSYEDNDPQCRATVGVNIIQVTGNSTATSIRLRVKAGSELQQKNVSAELVKLQKKTPGRWLTFKELNKPIQLIWTDTDTTFTDFDGPVAKYVNLFHIDQRENKLTIWRVQMPRALSAFLDDLTTYKATVSVLGRQFQVDVVWNGDGNTMIVEASQKPPKRPTSKQPPP